MSKQNKTVLSSLGKKRRDLEKELINDVLVASTSAEGPRAKDNNTSAFDVKTGFRRRHPAHVLNQFKGLVDTSVDIHSVWEQAMEDEDSKATASKLFDNTNYGITNQFGLDRIATDNFYKKKSLMDNMRVVGV